MPSAGTEHCDSSWKRYIDIFATFVPLVVCMHGMSWDAVMNTSRSAKSKEQRQDCTGDRSVRGVDFLCRRALLALR